MNKIKDTLKGIAIGLVVALVALGTYFTFDLWRKVSTIYERLDLLEQKIDDYPSTVAHKVKADLSLQEWNLVYTAICQIESNFNPLAANPESSARGICQQMVAYVDDVNRIAKTNYTYEDRFNPRKAREMFEIYQAQYNPEKDPYKAAQIHYGGPHGYRTNLDVLPYLHKFIRAFNNPNLSQLAIKHGTIIGANQTREILYS